MKWLVKEVVEFSKVIEADTEHEAIEDFGELNANTRQLRIKARCMLVRHTKNHVDCNGKPYFPNECPVCDELVHKKMI